MAEGCQRPGQPSTITAGALPRGYSPILALPFASRAPICTPVAEPAVLLPGSVLLLVAMRADPVGVGSHLLQLQTVPEGGGLLNSVGAVMVVGRRGSRVR